MLILLRPRFARLSRMVTLCAAVHVSAVVCAVGEPAAGAHRIFLRDGTAVVTMGEFARVGDRVVFSMPVSPDGRQLQVVTLPASAIDWPKTEQYLASVRAAGYAATQGEADYALLTAAVARTLTRVHDTNDPFERVQLVEQVRGIVATWGRDHYGYRSNDVRQIQNLLDELISELRADAGINQFDLNLVANVEAPVAPKLPAPTPAEAIEQVLRVARASDVPAERSALLDAAVRSLDRPVAGMPREWVKRTRETAEREIDVDKQTDLAYRDLTASMLARARSAAAHADAAGVERVLADVARRDARLGRKRPDEIAGLMHAVETQLDAARRLRLARDRWQLNYPMLREYARLIRRPMRQVSNAGPALDSIRRLHGPAPHTLVATRARLLSATETMQRITPPGDVAAIHASLASACQLALQATDLRIRAIQSGDLQVAWDASSAAAGAVMLITRAREQLQAALRPPELP